MLNSATTYSIKFCELVEHPGGHDGGEFPKYESFALADGFVTYYYSTPVCQCDAFVDDDPHDFNECPDRDTALSRLKDERDKLLLASKTITEIIEALESSSKYDVICEDDYND